MHGFVDRVQVDFITNNGGNLSAEGSIAQAIVQNRFQNEPHVGFDPGLMRPVIQTDGKAYCHILTGKQVRNSAGEQVAERTYVPLDRLISRGIVPVAYNTAALPYQTWQRIDRAVLRASRDRLNAWNDLAAANLYGGFDGMAVTGLVRDTMTDPGDAKVDMTGLTPDHSDAPLFVSDLIPLPIIHAGAEIDQRTLASTRNAGVPLDTTMIEACGRRCAETLEKMTVGTVDYTGVQMVTSSTDFTKKELYGFRNQAYRITKTDVTASASFVAGTFVNEIIAMLELARAQKFHGPFVLYYSTSWDQYMEYDYVVGTSAQGYTTVDKTVRQRVEMLEKIQRVAACDVFTNTDELLLVQMNSDTVRAIDGMDWTTVQWSEQGGAQLRLRVMGIKVPELRGRFVGTSTTVANRICGIVHGTTS
jgi:hypothetical protein